MMKPVTILKKWAIIAAVFYSYNALAYDDDKKKEACRQPKIQEFTLPEYSETNKNEAQPEEEFTFVVSGWAEPKKFKLSGKGKEIPFTVKSTETFHKVTAKLLPEFNGQTVRINARIPALLGCYSTVGWLVKVADKPGANEENKPADAAVPQDNKKGEEASKDGEVVSPQKTDKASEPESAAPPAGTSAPE
jgi:hypothetical protein